MAYGLAPNAPLTTGVRAEEMRDVQTPQGLLMRLKKTPVGQVVLWTSAAATLALGVQMGKMGISAVLNGERAGQFLRATGIGKEVPTDEEELRQRAEKNTLDANILEERLQLAWDCQIQGDRAEGEAARAHYQKGLSYLDERTVSYRTSQGLLQRAQLLARLGRFFEAEEACNNAKSWYNEKDVKHAEIEGDPDVVLASIFRLKAKYRGQGNERGE